jgi:ParB family transcriptional regulator, chromosome partitioning protein
MAKKTGLGRGLSAILQGDGDAPGFQHEAAAMSGITEIPIAYITPNPHQPRTNFDAESLSELAASIARHGVIQPITVREVGTNRYQIISGERRYRASLQAGLESLPVFVRNADDDFMLELALVENIQREDLDAIEIAISYQRLLEECSLTQEQLSDRVAKKRSTVANYLRLLNLPAEIQIAIREKRLSMGHARAIAGIEDAAWQMKVFRETTDKGLSVRQVEELVRNGNQKSPGKQKNSPTLPLSFQQQKLREDLENHLGTRIQISKQPSGAGKIVIAYSSESDFQRIAELLGV